MGRKFDVIIFGASGFTGKYVVETVVKLLKESKDEAFTWAVSGRSAAKLDDILQEASQATGEDLKQVEKVIADVSDSKALQEMARQCTVVINCVGPYRFFGEKVVEACILEGTHHVDVSGEPQFLEKVQLIFHKLAEENGVYVIGSCGFDSIPTDCGVTYLQQNFDGDLNSVESYLSLDNSGQATKVHYATYQSAIHGLANARELRPIRQQLFPESLPKPKYKIAQRSVMHFSDIMNGWCLPFPGSDRSVVMRSQRYFYEQEKQRPAQMQAYVKQPNLLSTLLTMFGALIFGVLAQFRIGRYLLEKFPRIFTAGFVTHEGPSREEMDHVKFTFTIVGEGWTEKLADPTDVHTDPPNKKMTVKVGGVNPGYGATCMCVIQAALTILRESNKMPSKGGVYPPGAAFAKTSLVDKLNKNGVTFAVEV